VTTEQLEEEEGKSKSKITNVKKKDQEMIRCNAKPNPG